MTSAACHLSLSPAQLEDPPLPRQLPKYPSLQPSPLPRRHPRARPCQVSRRSHRGRCARRLGTNAWRFGGDYARNYAWRSDWETYHEVYGAVSELNDLVRRLGDNTRMQGERKRAKWFRRNYRNVVGLAKAVFRLLGVFTRSGPLRDAVEAMRKEVVDGDFLRDCLEIGGNDLKGIIQVLKDLLLRLYSPSKEPALEVGHLPVANCNIP